jgi:hypothetical protein
MATYRTVMKSYQLVLSLGLIVNFLSCQKQPEPIKVKLINPARDTTIKTDASSFFEQQIQVNINSHLEHDALLEAVTRRWQTYDKQAKPENYIHTYYRIPVGQTITVLQDYGDQHRFIIRPLGTNKGTLDMAVYLPALENADLKHAVGCDSLVITPLTASDKY